MTIPAYKCICDSNIWVNVCLGEVHEAYIKKFCTVGVVEVVKNEILKWKEDNGRFQKISTFFIDYENKGLAVLDGSSLDTITKKIIDQELIRWGFEDTDNRSKTINDLGEFVSLLYAYHLDIPYIHTEDGVFSDTIKIDDLYEQYRGIEIISWNQVSGDLTDNDSERMALNQKVIQENMVMGKKRQEAKQEKTLENKILELQRRFSNR
ncbi:hypothetical protein SporoP8_03430 [Sporosarcina ureae]|uniref:hypothetical protein n=1 Tax=Sporosarcina ureae TaxID=1571 RepID=UPI000A1490B9|nr:hypothetical protein [Sporosarcina ureae]ARJ38027.1 hypothetical protein SporoP8_03430 [Sporosarcina ureae]